MEVKSSFRSGIRYALWLFVSLFTAESAYPCDPCGMHNSVQVPGVLSALRSTGLKSGGWMFTAQQQVSTFRTVGESELRTTEKDLELIRTLAVTQASVAYNVSEQFALQMQIPLVVRSFDRFERFRKVRDSEFGLGDASIFTTWSPYSWTEVDSRFFVAGVAGVKLPTGDTGSLKRVTSGPESELGATIQGRGLTLGTGSIDFPVGVVSSLRWQRLSLFSTAQYTFRGEGAADYQFANDTAWSVAPGWLFINGEEESFTLSAVVSGEHKGSDHVGSTLLPRTAQSNIYLGPEFFYALANRVSCQLAVDFPLSLDVGGAAVEPEMRVRGAISIGF